MANSTLKKIITMYGASVLGILIGFLVSIFNSRVLGPERFGDFKFIETAARFIASLVSVGFFISITRLMAMNDDKAKERRYVGLFTLIFAITSAVGILIYLGFSFLEPYFFDNELDQSIWRYFMIVMVIIGQLAMNEILKGMHKIYTLSLFGVLPAFLYLVVVYLIHEFITPVNIDWVLYGYYGFLMLVITVILIGLKPNFDIKKPLVRELFKENKYNGRPIYYGSLAGVATTHIAGFTISYFMDNTQVGFFMLANTVCSPLLVIPSVLGTIFFKKFVHLDFIPKKVVYFSVGITVLALVVFYTLIELAVITFYTEAYLPVSDISKLLILSFIFHGFGDLINRFLGAKGKGTLLRNAAFIVGFVNVLGYTLLVSLYKIEGAIITKILASGLYFAVMLWYYYNFTKINKQ
ncbi:MAG: oligosaccharide flippase family protein [Bacteroidota bacterium]